MRSLIALGGGLAAIVILTLAASGGVAYATFHCMRIHAVMGGFDGNNNIQYVELRMDIGAQNFVGGHTIEFRDAAGTLKATFTFPTNVTNSATGDSILVATQEFNAAATGSTADFTFSMANTVGANGGDPLHPVQGPGGKVTWAAGFSNCALTTPVDSVAYGGAPADYGTPAVALPNPSDNRALRLSDLSTSPTNNSTEYSLQPVATSSFAVGPANLPTDFTTPRNNSRTVLKLAAPASVGGIAEEPGVAVSGSRSAGAPGRGMGYVPFVSGTALLGALAAGGAWRVRRRRRRT